MKKISLWLTGSGVAVAGMAMTFLAHAADTPDYLIQASDTIPVFQNGAAALKSNGVAILNVAVPYLVGAFVALAVIGIVWAVVALVRRHTHGG